MVCDLRIYDVRGRLVRDLGRRQLPRGGTEWMWDGLDGNGLDMPSGLYFARASGDGVVTARQFVLLRH